MSTPGIRGHVNRTYAPRAIVCEGWRWMPGMSDDRGSVCVGRTLDSVLRWVVGPHLIELNPDPGDAVPMLPDLDNPATLGCLLALVREAWRDPGANVSRRADSERWFVVVAVMTAGPGHGGRRMVVRGVPRYLLTIEGATEAAALVAALETAPT